MAVAVDTVVETVEVIPGAVVVTVISWVCAFPVDVTVTAAAVVVELMVTPAAVNVDVSIPYFEEQ